MAPDEAADEQAEAPAEAKPEKPLEAKAEKAEEPSGMPPPPPGGIADLLKEALPDVVFEAYQGMTNVIVEVAPEDIPNVMPVAKENPNLDLSFLRVLFGVDHEADGLEVVYELMSIEKGHTVTIKTRVPPESPKVASVASIWNAADWHERETRDMFGIEFEGHPHLVPLLLPEDMTDHYPLRKSNELVEIEEWQADLVAQDGATGDDGGDE